MSPVPKTNPSRKLASQAFDDAYQDFMLSRQAINCTERTLEFYKYQVFYFLLWTEGQSVTTPNDITPRLVRQYIAERKQKGLSDRSLNAAARAIRTLVRFWHREGYMDSLIVFEIPKLSKKRLPVLDKEQLKKVLRACNIRDRALVMFMADSGVRRQEAIDLNWEDVNMQTGLVRVKQGKGRKDRATVVGATTRRALLAYKRTVKHEAHMPLFQGRTGQRLGGTGVVLIYTRLSKKTGIHVTAHAMRRTFVILSLRADMDAGHLQAMLGQTTLDMVYYYAQMVDEDLIREHRAHSPIDSLS